MHPHVQFLLLFCVARHAGEGTKIYAHAMSNPTFKNRLVISSVRRGPDKASRGIELIRYRTWHRTVNHSIGAGLDARESHPIFNSEGHCVLTAPLPDHGRALVTYPKPENLVTLCTESLDETRNSDLGRMIIYLCMWVKVVASLYEVLCGKPSIATFILS